ncbi:hypothetical protein N9H78_03615 [Winogradskyella sp.]|nr:hypothetical protein [Winogradskyella sp.]MDA8874741.1 hypothetical protein [Winogradskyella sp.]
MNDNGNYTLDDVKLDDNEISFDMWIDKYKPIKNHITKYPNTDSTFETFETYGEEYEHVLAQPVENVWTEVHADFSTLLVAGVAFVNRIAYYICEKPWTDDMETVVMSMDIECHCYDDSEEDGDYGDPKCPDCEGYGFRTVDTDDEEVKLYHKENA